MKRPEPDHRADLSSPFGSQLVVSPRDCVHLADVPNPHEVMNQAERWRFLGGAETRDSHKRAISFLSESASA
jgi:hypothetical protein